MKILVLAWEFPPRIVGGIARHVAELYPEIVKLEHDVYLITVKPGDAPMEEIVEGIKIERVSVTSSDDFFQWVESMNASMEERITQIISKIGTFDLIHAHDWLVADAAITIKHQYKIPLIATIHATEYGRNHGIHNDTNAYIAKKEGNLIYNAWRVIVCSDYMRHEVHQALGCPWDKIDVVYNGIRAEKKKQLPDFDHLHFRRQFADDEEKIIYYVGRMTYEKGIHIFLNAAPQVLAKTNGKARFIIIGGGNTSHLQNQAGHLGIWEYCDFTGFMSEDNLNKFQTIADCAVFPSLYEPFGIVALESFAARVPVVVSDSGGLPEVVRHGQTGIVTHANNPDSLAWGIMEVINNPVYAQSLVEQAYQDLALRFQWSKLGQQTEAIYDLVVGQRQKVSW